MKHVLLTSHFEGEIFEEHCYLVSDDAAIYTIGGGIMIPDFADKAAKDGYVLFQDGLGLFMVKAEHIIEIKEIPHE